ncbi:uncharacterized protein EAF01_006981 [Botrytis porri]|uniref:uncharacterized protein n=1 Tax=Botrytis porri TaxID=87229 RepID=UPI0019025018|nr:uncharacterized protein EAF01_006981 [Botrytis porri]KAF7901682.1 hypothetical protein EAF01_006981 [Botrytis porri]
MDQDDNGPEYGTSGYHHNQRWRILRAYWSVQGHLIFWRTRVSRAKSKWFPEISHHARGVPIILVLPSRSHQ